MVRGRLLATRSAALALSLRLSPRTSPFPEIHLETGVSPRSLHYAQHGCTSEEILSGHAQAPGQDLAKQV